MAFLDDNQLMFASYYEPSHKIWGWFRSKRAEDRRGSPYLSDARRPMEVHAFWGVIGKTITVKRHVWRSNMNHVRDKKLAGKYEEISEERLLELWPMFYEDLDQRMLFLTLSGGLDA